MSTPVKKDDTPITALKGLELEFFLSFAGQVFLKFRACPHATAFACLMAANHFKHHH